MLHGTQSLAKETSDGAYNPRRERLVRSSSISSTPFTSGTSVSHTPIPPKNLDQLISAHGRSYHIHTDRVYPWRKTKRVAFFFHRFPRIPPRKPWVFWVLFFWAWATIESGRARVEGWVCGGPHGARRRHGGLVSSCFHRRDLLSGTSYTERVYEHNLKQGRGMH